MTTATIRSMATADVPGLTALLREMQAHYGVPCPPEGEIARSLGATPDGTSILVAETREIVGFAAVCAIYPGPGLKAGLFLKELFVRRAERGSGIGRLLMRAVASFAVERGFARVDWTADRAEERLLAFYRETGAQAQPEKVFFRLTGPALSEFARGPEPVSGLAR